MTEPTKEEKIQLLGNDPQFWYSLFAAYINKTGIKINGVREITLTLKDLEPVKDITITVRDGEEPNSFRITLDND